MASSMAEILAWTSLFSALVALAFALIIWRADRRGRRNRHLALLLVAEAGFQGALASVGWMDDGYAPILVPWFALTLISIAFLLFTTTLEGRLARALSGWVPRGILVGTCLVILALSLGTAQNIIEAGGTPAEVENDVGWPWPLFAVASLLSLAISIETYMSAPVGSATRRRARAYALAFGFRDALYAAIVVWWALATYVIGDPAVAEWGAVASSCVTVVFVALLAYGILSTQLFDIDLKLKLGISRGTVASVALAVVFVVSKVVEVYASRTGGFIAGAVAAGLLMFAAPRLNRLGDKVANTAMPAVQPTSQYVAYKKLEVYRAAVESAVEGDKAIDAAERAMLDRLRVKLGLDLSDAQAIEAEVAGA